LIPLVTKLSVFVLSITKSNSYSYTMPLPLLDALSAPLESIAGPSRITSEELPSKVGEIWESAWTNYAKGKEVDDKSVDVVKAVLEIAGRELTISRIQDGSVSYLGRYGEQS
jgi:hypothetical protein